MGYLAKSAERAEQCSEILKAVAHPLRLRIVAILAEGPQNVSGLVELLGASQPTVSQQLRILRMAELVSVVRQSGFSRYSLTEPHLAELIECVERCGDLRARRRARAVQPDTESEE